MTLSEDIAKYQNDPDYVAEVFATEIAEEICNLMAIRGIMRRKQRSKRRCNNRLTANQLKG
jgi:hypothetical protein